jgi:hypothetical protein
VVKVVIRCSPVEACEEGNLECRRVAVHSKMMETCRNMEKSGIWGRMGRLRSLLKTQRSVVPYYYVIVGASEPDLVGRNESR